jgi:hypothetical protein
MVRTCLVLTRLKIKPNKALKVVAAPLDVSNRRMLRILRAACSRPLAWRYMAYV